MRTMATARFPTFPARVDLDFIEDCRSFALADFDHDGRLEVAVKRAIVRNFASLKMSSEI